MPLADSAEGQDDSKVLMILWTGHDAVCTILKIMVQEKNSWRCCLTTLVLILVTASACGDPTARSLTEPRLELASLILVLQAEGTSIATLSLEISAHDIPVPLTFSFEIAQGMASGTLTVPIGSDRVVKVASYDDLGVQTHSGEAIANVVQGPNPVTTVGLSPLTGDLPVEVKFGSVLVVVEPWRGALELDQTIQFSAALISVGGQVSPIDVQWISFDPATATVSNDGLATPVDTGTVTIAAVHETSVGFAQLLVGPAVLVGAGDIATCERSGDEATANLLDGIEGTVFTVGDNVYPDGKSEEFANCYEPSWGRHLERTRPSPGNHDYHTGNAAGFFGYFGARAGQSGTGYYAYNLGGWLILSLNSNIDRGFGSPQIEWLRSKLESSDRMCTLAYWHHPRYTSGSHGNNPSMNPMFETIYEAGVDVVLVGHDHDYERFAPMNVDGDQTAEGVRQFVVGIGGSSLRQFGAVHPSSEFRYSEAYGVLKLTLFPRAYEWQLITVDNASVVDAGHDSCH